MPRKRTSTAAASKALPKSKSGGKSVVLPRELRSAVDQAILDRPAGLESVRKIYDHFKLREQGTRYSAFSDYVRRESWRARLGAVGQVVEAMLGSPKEKSFEGLCDSAMLGLMSRVFETLQDDKVEIPTAELVKISKIIAEQRATALKEKDAAMKQARPDGESQSAKSPHSPLPDNFAEVIGRIYGVEVKDKEQSTKDKNE